MNWTGGARHRLTQARKSKSNAYPPAQPLVEANQDALITGMLQKYVPQEKLTQSSSHHQKQPSSLSVCNSTLHDDEKNLAINALPKNASIIPSFPPAPRPTLSSDCNTNIIGSKDSLMSSIEHCHLRVDRLENTVRDLVHFLFQPTSSA